MCSERSAEANGLGDSGRQRRPRRPRVWLAAAMGAVVVMSAAWPAAAQRGWRVVEAEGLDAAGQAQLERAKAAQQAMGRQLMAKLDAAIGQSGPAGAIDVCKREAPQIAKQVARRQGVRIGRTGHKLRNLGNRPPRWAKPFIAQRVDQPRVLMHRDGRLALLSPIRIQPLCLNCHGPEEDLAEPVRAALAEQYPKDQATGFSLDELRGWFWVVAPAGGSGSGRSDAADASEGVDVEAEKAVSEGRAVGRGGGRDVKGGSGCCLKAEGQGNRAGDRGCCGAGRGCCALGGAQGAAGREAGDSYAEGEAGAAPAPAAVRPGPRRDGTGPHGPGPGALDGRGGVGRGGPPAHAGRGGGRGAGRGAGAGAGPGAGAGAGTGTGPRAGAPMMAHESIHYLLEHHDKIERTVERIDGGVLTVTTSDDAEVTAHIRRHVRQMKQRLESGHGMRHFDPLFVELFRNYRKISMTIEDVDGGVKVRETSDDPNVVLLIRQHAERGVSEFVERGFERARESSPLPEGYRKGGGE